MYSANINKCLQRISNILLLNTSFIQNTGLLSGKLGIAIFFFHYYRYTKNIIYQEFAEELIRELYREIDSNTEINFAEGLIGVGVGIEYLAQNDFIEPNTDMVLEEIDKLVQHYTVHHPPQTVDLAYGIAGLGKYFSMRLTKKDKNSLSAIKNREHLLQIVNLLSVPYNSYQDILSVIDFLSDLYLIHENSKQSDYYLNYAIDKLETMLHEDLLFGIYPGNFSPLCTAAYLITAFEKTGLDKYKENAISLLKKYEFEFRNYLCYNSAFEQLKSNFLYGYLGTSLRNEAYLKESEYWLSTSLENINITFSDGGENNKFPPAYGLLNGYAGMGLFLLINELNSEKRYDTMGMINILPLMFEDNKTNYFQKINQKY